MLSIIICSVSPERLEQVTRNIHDTIGVDYEIIAIDNREKQWPIARAYNEGASRAHYPFLFFVHEDVKFHSVGWGKCIEKKLKEPDCGVIGFAGSKVKLKCYSGWGDVYKWDVIFYYQSVGTETQFRVASVTMEHPFKEVLVLDGFAMFVRKDGTWSPVGRTMVSPTVFWMVSRSNTFSYWADRVAFSVCSLVIWLRREATSPLSTVYCTWLSSSSTAKAATAKKPMTAKGATCPAWRTCTWARFSSWRRTCSLRLGWGRRRCSSSRRGSRMAPPS